ncbi:hypothetical protein CCAN12_760038 [Capnocytophaga canimorsus]|uniref:Uncharacterized protein n=1 Tax=Capnocytophaga canimorsus TaxID=28188 RepID=A0A0B7HN57_9FLAO|nr:hypothetical protein CCAN12_760038 [Capnocytophaga canimorsus]
MSCKYLFDKTWSFVLCNVLFIEMNYYKTESKMKICYLFVVFLIVKKSN